METLLAKARAFVTSMDLSEPRLFASTRMPNTIAFESDKTQALVVGSEVVSFVKDIDAKQRSDVVNALLLAQLRARKVEPQLNDIAGLRRWYGEYFGVLSQIGFAVRQTELQKYQGTTDGFEAHEAVLELAASLLVGAPAALAVLKSAMAALQKMDVSNPWITLFNRESRSANTAHFQVTTADLDRDGSFFVVMTAFGIEAASNITQVLFFKFRAHDVAIEHHAAKASINATLLGGIREELARKLAAHASGLVGNLEI